MSARRILQLVSVSPRFDARLVETFGAAAIARDEQVLSDPAAIALVATTARRGCEAALMARLPRLEAICSFGVGLDAIDLDAARAQNIAVSATPGVLDDCVADLAFGLLLAAARRIGEGDRFIRAQNWRDGALPLGARVSGKKLGVLGLGQIGKTIARRAGGFDMVVGYHNRRRDLMAAAEYFDSAEALAQWADFLVVATPGGASTRHLVDATVLQALGKHGFLVNIARGSVVDEPALFAALRDKTIAGAALDVFCVEPQGAEAFAALDNVVLTPHVGSATVETRQAMEDRLFANILRFFREGRLENPVF